MAQAKHIAKSIPQYHYDGFNFIVIGGKRKQLTANISDTTRLYRVDQEANEIYYRVEHGQDIGSDMLFSNGDPLAILMALEEADEAGLL